MFQPTLLNKEAAAINSLLGAGALGSKVFKNRGAANQAVNPRNVHFHSQGDVDKGVADKVREDGNGMFADMGIWTAGKLTPRSWDTKEKILTPLNKAKQKMDEVSTEAAGKIVGNRSDKSMIGKFFSTPDYKVVGTERLPDGSRRELGALQRKTSLTAPIENTMKWGAPILGSMYVAEKMYPQDKAQGEPEEKRAFESDLMEEKNGLEDELLTANLDKAAAMDKVAELQDQLEKMASEIVELEGEKNLFWKKAEAEQMEKKAALIEKQKLEMELFEKQALYEEHRLRTTAQARSKNAVKVAEEMLEKGLIKQAEFDGEVDFLMDCDDKTFNLRSSLIKQAKTDEKGLETSAYIVDYRSKDEESSQHRAGRGVNKKGQTIGEAAKDLKK